MEGVGGMGGKGDGRMEKEGECGVVDNNVEDGGGLEWVIGGNGGGEGDEGWRGELLERFRE